MKKSVTIVIAILLLAMPLLAQEEKYTEEEALQLVAAYESREGEANAKIEKEQVKIESLKAQLSEVDQAIADIKAEIESKEEIYKTYVVKPGDWLSKLAEYPEVYGWGNYARWKEIFNANKDLIKDPDLIYPNWTLKIPRE